ncbi:hypothetical protein Taro_055826 [Colocasia esculenta]|uniref:ASCH domain-containing protein n=1 Tax=Colocasia esculenta TaxID=4460 RepID=A0A843XSD4_COLES|nr:hypothetical protein [Colocasia esculenta]
MSGSRGVGRGNYRNPCLTMHQPWASLLVHGIKRIEGRSWPAPLTGRLWIHAASKIPEPDTIKAMEDFYRAIYAMNGITDLKFPEHYPVSRLLGCVEVVGCVKREELTNWEEVPESVRLEGQTDYCWLCEQPQKLIIPFEMRGYQGVYNLEKKIFEAAMRGLSPVNGPQTVKFPLPNPDDNFSLKPGSLAARFHGTTRSAVEKTARVDAAIAGARAAATQFLKKDQNKSFVAHQKSSVQNDDVLDADKTGVSASKIPTDSITVAGASKRRYVLCTSSSKDSGHEQSLHRTVKPQFEAPSKLFAAAMKHLQ